MPSVCKYLAAALAGTALASPSYAGLATPSTQLVNGNFSSPLLATSQYAYPNATVGGWTYAPGAALINAQGTSDFYGATPPSGTRGKQFAAIQKISSIDQVFHAYATQRIEISWYAAGRPTSPDGLAGGNQSYAVSLANESIDTNPMTSMFSTTTGSAFAFNKAFFNVIGGDNYDLVFRGFAKTDQTAFIGSVGLYAAPVTPAFHQPLSYSFAFAGGAGGAVPEPAAWSLLLMGFGLLGAAARRRTGRTITA